MPAPAFKIVSRLVSSTLLSVALHGVALGQTPDKASSNTSLSDTVSWTVSAQSADSVKQGTSFALEVRGAVVDGWHVYALEQLPRGPIPLRVTLDANEVAEADGALSATPPTKSHDTSFNLDTQYYAKDFTLTVPVRIGSDVAPGPQQIPVSVRFQSCNGQTCRPPKTVHLSASVNVRKGG